MINTPQRSTQPGAAGIHTCAFNARSAASTPVSASPPLAVYSCSDETTLNKNCPFFSKAVNEGCTDAFWSHDLHFFFFFFFAMDVRWKGYRRLSIHTM